MEAALKQKTEYTYADYMTWPEGQRWELLNGTAVPWLGHDAYAMTAPTGIHQKIVSELVRQIGNYLQDKACEVYVAPFDVRLPADNEADAQVDTVVQPDISVICDKTKLDDKGCRGAPDWIIEVLSPATALKDLDSKRLLYQQHGMQEYWVMHPTEKWGMIYLLNAQVDYQQTAVFALTTATPVKIFTDLLIDWSFLATE